MGIKVESKVEEFEDNDKLALRAYGTEGREPQECLPRELIQGTLGWFLKRGKRNYSTLKDINLHETRGYEQISDPLASIRMVEVTYFPKDGQNWTKGMYEVKKVYDSKGQTASTEGLEARV